MDGMGKVLAFIFSEPHSGELKTRVWRKEIAIGRPNVRKRRGTGTATQHKLVAHELSVVFADGAFGRTEAGVRQIRAAGPLPYVSEHLLQRIFSGGRDRMIKA